MSKAVLYFALLIDPSFVFADPSVEIFQTVGAPGTRSVEDSDTGEKFFLPAAVSLAATDFQAVRISEEGSETTVRVKTTEIGRDKLANLTAENLEKRLVTLVDGKFFTAPIVRAPVTGGELSFTRIDRQKALAERLQQAVVGKNIAPTVTISFHLAEPDASKEFPQELSSSDGTLVYAAPNPILTEADVRGATMDTQPGDASVQLHFSPDGAHRFADITGHNKGKRLAILVDGKLVTAPVIREEIWGGTASISGGFSPEEARAIVDSLNRVH